jgi:hypothetical protein
VGPEPQLRGSGLGAIEVEIEIDAVAIRPAAEVSFFPGGPSGLVAVPAPSFQRIRPVVRLTPERPTALVGGLRDPFRPSGGERPQRDLLLVVALRATGG